jgi:hypothetical protein
MSHHSRCAESVLSGWRTQVRDGVLTTRVPGADARHGTPTSRLAKSGCGASASARRHNTGRGAATAVCSSAQLAVLRGSPLTLRCVRQDSGVGGHGG